MDPVAQLWDLPLPGAAGGATADLLALEPADRDRALAPLLAARRPLHLVTRAAVRCPGRLSTELAERLAAAIPPAWVLVHVHHPAELSLETVAALGRLRRAGVPVLHQAVLYRRLNTDAGLLAALVESLADLGIPSTRLSLCPPAPGLEELAPPVAAGIEIAERLRALLPAPLVPLVVLEAPDGGGEVPVGPQYLLGPREDGYVVRDARFALHRYPETGARDCAVPPDPRYPVTPPGERPPELRTPRGAGAGLVAAGALIRRGAQRDDQSDGSSEARSDRRGERSGD